MEALSLEAIDNEIDTLINNLEYQYDILEKDEVFNPFEAELLIRLDSLRNARAAIRLYHSQL